MKLEVGRTYKSIEGYVTICHRLNAGECASHLEYVGYPSDEVGNVRLSYVGLYTKGGYPDSENPEALGVNLSPIQKEEGVEERLSLLEKEISTLKQKLKEVGE